MRGRCGARFSCRHILRWGLRTVGQLCDSHLHLLHSAECGRRDPHRTKALRRWGAGARGRGDAGTRGRWDAQAGRFDVGSQADEILRRASAGEIRQAQVIQASLPVASNRTCQWNTNQNQRLALIQSVFLAINFEKLILVERESHCQCVQPPNDGSASLAHARAHWRGSSFTVSKSAGILSSAMHWRCRSRTATRTMAAISCANVPSS